MPIASYVTIDGRQIVAQPDPAQFPQLAGKANCYLCPRGKEYGRGWLLMRRGDVTSLNLEVSHTIAFVQADTGGATLSQVRLQGAWIIKATKLAQAGGLSGPTNDVNSPYLVEFVDRRYLLCKMATFRQDDTGESYGRSYNVRHRLPQTAALTGATAAEYMPASLLEGTTIATWDTMLRDIWRTMGGWDGSKVTYTNFVTHDWPGLPYSPNGIPQGWHFWGANPWFAIHEVLKKIDCDSKYDPILDRFTIVRLGTNQTDWRSASNLPYKYDADVLMSNAARIPRQVYSGFHMRQVEPCMIDDRLLPSGNDDVSASATVTGLGATATGAGIPATLITGSSAFVWDDLLYQADLESPLGGGAANNATAKARAQERFQNYQSRCYVTDFESKRCWNGIVTSVLPGSEIDLVAWRHHGMGGEYENEGYETWASSGHGNAFPWSHDCEEKPLPTIGETISPPNFGRHGWDMLWPRSTSLVQVTDNTSAVSAVAGVFLGIICRLNPSGGLGAGGTPHNNLVFQGVPPSSPEVVWIVPVNRLGAVLSGDYELTNTGIYIGQLMGTWQAQTSPFSTHALYAVQAVDGDILGSPFTVLTDLLGGMKTIQLPVSWGG